MAKYDILRAWELRENGYSLSHISKKTGIPKPYLSFLFSYCKNPEKTAQKYEEKIRKLEREKRKIEEENEEIYELAQKEFYFIIFLALWLFSTLIFSLAILMFPSQKNIDIYTYFDVISIIILISIFIYFGVKFR